MTQPSTNNTNSRSVVVIGGGGHAKVVISSLRAAGRTVGAVLDDDPSLTGSRILDVPVVGGTDRIHEYRMMEAVIAIGDNRRRYELAQRLDCDWTTVLHPCATVDADAELGPGTVVFAGAVIQPGARIGAHCIINTSASVDHDCEVHSFSHLAPGVHLGAEVRIGVGAFLGLGASVLPRVQVGDWGVLGSGAVAIHDIEASSVQVGVPARPAHSRPPLSPGALSLAVNSARGTSRIDWTFIGPTDPRWRALLARVRHDFYHLPEYVVLSAGWEGGEPLAFFAEDTRAACLIPLLLKRCPAHHVSDPPWCDLISPYGYPSPLFTDPDDKDSTSAFMNRFRDAADEIGACSAFLRLHPILTSVLGTDGTLSASQFHGQTVVVDLTVSEQEMWAQTRRGHRYEIRRLQNRGFSVVMDEWSLYPDFVRMYAETAARIGYEDSYRFDGPYFERMRTKLADNLHLSCVLSPDGRPVAAGVFMLCDGIVQYHLSASDAEYQHLAPTKLMLHFVRMWARSQNATVLHLGGGVGARRDGLFEFKAGFSPNRAPFCTLRMIVNEHRFAALNLSAGRSLDLRRDLAEGFFPPYRQSQTRAVGSVVRNAANIVVHSSYGQ